MPRWTFSYASLKNKEDRGPWNAAIISYLELKQVFGVMPDIHISMAKYDDPPEVSFLTQFVRLKLFLDAKWLDETGQVWKELQEVDPGFRKIRHIYHFAVCDSDVKPDGFPKEWKDEKYFINWLHVNVMTQLRILDEGTLRRGTDVILHTNYVKKWKAEKEGQYELKKIEEDLEREKLALETGKLTLEKKQKKWEAKLAKDVKKLVLNTQRKLITNSKKMMDSMGKEKHASDQSKYWMIIWAEHAKQLRHDNPILGKEIRERAKEALDKARRWMAKSDKERGKQDRLQREQDKLVKELNYYDGFIEDP